MLKNGLKKLSAVLAVSAIAIGMSPICMPSNAIRTRGGKRNFGTNRRATLQTEIDAFNREGRELNMMRFNLVASAGTLDIPRYDRLDDYFRATDREGRSIANLSGLSSEELENIARVTLIAHLVISGIQGAPNLNIETFDTPTQNLIREADNLFHRFTAHNQERDRLIEAGAIFAE